MESILTPLMYAIPSDPSVTKVIITKEAVEDSALADVEHDESKLTALPAETKKSKAKKRPKKNDTAS